MRIPHYVAKAKGIPETMVFVVVFVLILYYVILCYTMLYVSYTILYCKDPCV